MKNILSKFLYVILALVVLICLFIGLCGVNPELAEPFKDMAANVERSRQTQVEEAPAESSAVASVDISFALPEETEEEETVEVEPTYDDFVKKRDLDGVLDDAVLENQGASEDPYRKLVESGADDDIFDDEYFQQFDDKSDYVVTEPEVYDITDDKEASEIVDNTGFGELGEDAEFDPLYYPYYQMLKDDGKSLYKQIYANCNAMIPEFKPVKNCTPKEWAAAFDCVFYDHPELFWMSNHKYFEYDHKGKVIKVGLVFYPEIPDVEAAKRQFDAAAKEILVGATGLSTTYDKEKYIHDTLVKKITYQFNALDQSSYSSVPNDYTVCCGYAKAFQYLMQKLEVPTYFCIGWGGEMHAWNIIKLDDGYYNVDCTWDDQGDVIYDYFNVSDRNNLMHSRMYESRYLPACNGGKYSGLEKSEPDFSLYGLAEDKVFDDLDAYNKAVVDAVAADFLAGNSDSDFRLMISQDIFMDWYLANFEGAYAGEFSDSQFYDEENFDLNMVFEHLNSGDYLVRHHVNFKVKVN